MKRIFIMILIACMGAMLSLNAIAEASSGQMPPDQALLSIQENTEESKIAALIGEPDQIREATPMRCKALLYHNFLFAGYKGRLNIAYAADNKTLTYFYWVFFRDIEGNGMETYRYFVDWLSQQLGEPDSDIKKEYEIETIYTTRWDDYAMIYRILLDKEVVYKQESYHFYKFFLDLP